MDLLGRPACLRSGRGIGLGRQGATAGLIGVVVVHGVDVDEVAMVF